METYTRPSFPKAFKKPFTWFKTGPRTFDIQAAKAEKERLAEEARVSDAKYWYKVRHQKAAAKSRRNILSAAERLEKVTVTSLAPRTLLVKKKSEGPKGEETLRKRENDETPEVLLERSNDLPSNPKKSKPLRMTQVNRRVRYLIKTLQSNTLDMVSLGGRVVVQKRFNKLGDDYDSLKSRLHKFEHFLPLLDNLNNSVFKSPENLKKNFVSVSDFLAMRRGFTTELESMKAQLRDYQKKFLSSEKERFAPDFKKPPSSVSYTDENRFFSPLKEYSSLTYESPVLRSCNDCGKYQAEHIHIKECQRSGRSVNERCVKCYINTPCCIDKKNVRNPEILRKNGCTVSGCRCINFVFHKFVKVEPLLKGDRASRISMCSCGHASQDHL